MRGGARQAWIGLARTGLLRFVPAGKVRSVGYGPSWQRPVGHGRLGLVRQGKVMCGAVMQVRIKNNIMEKVEYSFKIGIYKNLSAADAYAELMNIREKNGGELTPEAVVEASKDEGSVLHSVFEWNDELAAFKWRVEQARMLIKNISVTITTEKSVKTYRAIVSIVPSDGGERTYSPLPEVIKDDAAYKCLLAQAKEEAQNYVEKYSQLKELNGVKREMLKVINGVYPEE